MAIPIQKTADGNAPNLNAKYDNGIIAHVIPPVTSWNTFILPVAWTTCEKGWFREVIVAWTRTRQEKRPAYSGTPSPNHIFRI